MKLWGVVFFSRNRVMVNVRLNLNVSNANGNLRDLNLLHTCWNLLLRSTDFLPLNIAH